MVQVRRFHPDDRPAVDRIIALRDRSDGYPALSEHKAIRLGSAAAGGGAEWVLVDAPEAAGGRIFGYAQAAVHRSPLGGTSDRTEIEVVVAPDDIVAGVAADLATGSPDTVDATPAQVGRTMALIKEALADTAGDGIRTVWAWRAADVVAVTALGLAPVRSLLEMRRPLPLVRTWSAPPGIEIRTFRPGSDEDTWLEMNNAAFAGHPENGSLDRSDLAIRMAQPWFDPAGFLMAWGPGNRLLGSCWTKLHDDGVGEIYIVGVAPDGQGAGLGTALVIAALDDLHHRQGAIQAQLYVEEANTGAVAFYQGLGFTTVRTLREYTSG